MTAKKVLRLKCPDCPGKPDLVAAALTQEDRMVLIAACKDCHATIVLDIEDIITRLYEPPAKGN